MNVASFYNKHEETSMNRRSILKLFAAAMLCACLSPANAAEFGTKDEAIAMVKKVQAMYKAKGLDETVKAVQDPANKDFHDRDMYPTIYKNDGTVLAHGSKPALAGKNLMEAKDPDGKEYIKDRMKQLAASGGGWLDYKFQNPVSKAIEDKTTYTEKLVDKDTTYAVSVGIYKK
jgi:signal transduction histidine kinase